MICPQHFLSDHTSKKYILWQKASHRGSSIHSALESLYGMNLITVMLFIFVIIKVSISQANKQMC